MKLLFKISFFLLLLSNYSYAENITFRNKFIELATDDGVLDKNDYQALKKLASDPNLHDKEFAEDTLKNLAKYNGTIGLEYTLQRGFFNENVLKFTFSPTYSESDKISGQNIIEAIANISQRDNLSQTISDGDRCAASSLIDSYLLMGGSFSKLADKFNLSHDFTYRNIHILQDKLYNLANKDKMPGLYAGYKYKSYPNGKIVSVVPSGEIIDAAKVLNLKLIPLIGNTVSTIHQRKNVVDNFFKSNPNGVIQVGVFLDLKTGDIRQPNSESEQNHVITLFKLDQRYYIIDTGAVNNGTLSNIKAINTQTLNSMVYNTLGIVIGLIPS